MRHLAMLVAVVGSMASSGPCAGEASPSPAHGKLTVWPSIAPGQVLMSATMPDLGGYSFNCVIVRSKYRGEFVGRLEAAGYAPVTIRGSANDMYQCVPNIFRPGTRVQLVSSVKIDEPVGVTGQVQMVPGATQ